LDERTAGPLVDALVALHGADVDAGGIPARLLAVPTARHSKPRSVTLIGPGSPERSPNARV